jgi:hypothetical protein
MPRYLGDVYELKTSIYRNLPGPVKRCNRGTRQCGKPVERVETHKMKGHICA